MQLGYAVYVLTEEDEGAVIDGPVQVVEAPLEDDGHDAEIGNRIDLILDGVEAQYHVRRLKKEKWKNAHARAYVLLACRGGLRAGRYGKHVKARWLKKLPRVKDVELSGEFAAHVVTCVRSLYDHARSCLGRGDGYEMEASYILLGYVQDEYQRWFEENQGPEEKPMPFYGDTISGRVRRFRVYTDGFTEQEVCGDSGVDYDLYPFPGGVSFQGDPLEVVECPRGMRGEHVVPPSDYHKSFARINGFRTLITDVDDIVRDSDHVQTERFAEEVKRKGHETVQLGVAFELDMERYVGEGRWCSLP